MDKTVGRYQLLEEIATGGQGAVYRAFDPQTGRIVALKVLHPSLTGNRNYLERFRREASLAASIDHPNVVKIFEVGEHRDRHYMALEFFPENLARVIESGGPMRIDRAATFGVQIAEGLKAAHALGIVHRDVKPQNVLISENGIAKVTDFGIARAGILSTMTATGAVIGTPHYMSPEQARGDRADLRSDVYSLGCVLYEMLTGDVPFKAETPLAVIRQHIEERPRPLRERRRDVPRQVASVVERSMDKDPDRRYRSAEELAAALRASVPGLAQAGRGAHDLPASPSARAEAPPPARRLRDAGVPRHARRSVLRPLLRLVFVAAVIAVAAGGFILTSEGGSIELPEVRSLFDTASNGGRAAGTGPDRAAFSRDAPAAPISGFVDGVGDGRTDPKADDAGIYGCMSRLLGEGRVRDMMAGATPTREESQLIEGRCLDGQGRSLPQGPQIYVMAQVDGRSQLEIRGDSVRWFHFDDAAPGREGSSNFPTMMNGLAWMPAWPDELSTENRDCACPSDEFNGLQPALPKEEVGVELEVVRARGAVSITETPSADNEFALVVEFDDRDEGGPDWYEVRIVPSFTVAGSPSTGRTAMGQTRGGLRRGATISGRVTSEATGLPLARVHVDADPTGDGRSAGGDTDGDGRYTLTGLAPGTYTVTADGNGSGHIRTFYAGRLNRDHADVITVTGSDAVDGIDFSLEMGASLMGKVTDAETGLPIADIGLSAGPVGRNHLSWDSTDSSGRYVLRGLPAGLAIEVEMEGHDYVRARVEVLVGEAGTRRTAHFTLELGTTISGRVLDADTGLPIPDVEIEADNVNGEGPNAYARTDSRGGYTLRGVARGAYRVRVNWNDHGYIREYYDGKLSWDTADFVTVSGDGPITGVDFSLAMGATIFGRVVDEDTGLPLADVNIHAEGVRDESHNYARTDANGFYALRGTAPGAYTIKAQDDGQGYVEMLYGSSFDGGRVEPVTVLGMETVEGIDFALRMGGTISGQVVDADTGLPIADMDVGAGPAGQGHVSWARTDRNGGYTLRGIPAGFIEVYVSGQGYVGVGNFVQVAQRGNVTGFDF